MQLKLTPTAAIMAASILRNKPEVKERVHIRMVKRLLDKFDTVKEPAEVEIDESCFELLVDAINERAKMGIPGVNAQAFSEVLDAIEPLEKK